MNNIIFCNLGQDRGTRDRLKVLFDVLDRSLFGDRDDICLFSQLILNLLQLEVSFELI